MTGDPPTPACVIRPSRPSDAPAIAALLTDAVLHSHAHFGEKPVDADEVRQTMRRTADRYPWLTAEAIETPATNAAQPASPTARPLRVLGFARAGSWKTREAYAWTVETSVYLVAEARGQGLGTRLYRRLFAILDTQGYRTALGGIARPNDASERLHKAVGMTLVGVLPVVGYKAAEWRDVAYYARHVGTGPPGPVLTVRDALRRLGPLDPDEQSPRAMDHPQVRKQAD